MNTSVSKNKICEKSKKSVNNAQSDRDTHSNIIILIKTINSQCLECLVWEA